MELQKITCCKNVQIAGLQNPNQANYDWMTLNLCGYLKLVSAVIINFTKIKPLRSYKK